MDKLPIQVFLDLKNKLYDLMNDDRNALQIPYRYLYYKMDIFKQNITFDNLKFINDIFISICEVSSIENKFLWPHNIDNNLNKEKNSKLIENLIFYSEKLGKLESLIKSPNWMILCELSQPDILMTEFLKDKSISTKTINQYKSLLKAQLLLNLYESYDDKYCNTNQIISFFNQFVDRFSIIDDKWISIEKLFI